MPSYLLGSLLNRRGIAASDSEGNINIPLRLGYAALSDVDRYIKTASAKKIRTIGPAGFEPATSSSGDKW